MDSHSLELLEFDRIREILKGYAASPLGRQIAHSMSPIHSRDKISISLQQTTEMRWLLEARVRLPLAGLRDIAAPVASTPTAGTPLEPNTLLDIRSTLEASAALKELCSSLGPDYPRLSSLARSFLTFDQLCERIDKTIDPRGLVRDHASPKLANVRRKIEALHRTIREKAYTLAQSPRFRNLLQQTTATPRHGRYTLPVKVTHKHLVPGVIHDHSQSGQTVFIEPQELVDLGNQLDDAQFEERQEVSRILWELTKAVSQQRHDILGTLRALAWFDFTYAKARYSLAFKMSQPQLSPDGHLSLHEARHPLLLWLESKRQQPDPFQTVVPISVRLGEDFDILVITGPNTGGKTVTLKTIGLLSLMVQSGLHVPAAPQSRIPIFRNVFIDVGDEQSIEASLSTFSSHVSRITEILRHADRKSLVLMDELGAGTDPAEGAALGTSVLEFLARTGARVAVTTHLGSLKSYAYTAPRVENASVEFDDKTLAPTYRLTIGQPGSSNAVAIARRLGLPPDLLSRAEQILNSEPPETRALIKKMEKATSSAERNRKRAVALRKEAEKLHDQYRQELETVKNLRQRLTREADHELHTILSHIKRRIDASLHELRQGPEPVAQRAESLARQIDTEILNTPLGKKHTQFVKKLRQGDQVYLPHFDTTATVYSIDRKKGTVRLRFGNASLETSFEEISWAK